MNDRRQMTLDEFDLLVRSVYREWLRDHSVIRLRSDSIFYEKVHIFSGSFGAVWISLGEIEYEISKPSGLFRRKEKKKWNAAAALLANMRKGHLEGSTEELICKHVPSAVDILAEKVLVDDGDEASNSPS